MLKKTYLKVAEKVLECVPVWNDCTLPPAVYGTDQGEGQMKNVTV